MKPTKTRAVVLGVSLALIGVALMLATIPVYNYGGSLSAVWSTPTGRFGSTRVITVLDAMLMLGVTGVVLTVLGAAFFLKIWFAAIEND